MTLTLPRRRVVAALAGLPFVGFALARREAEGAAPDFRLYTALEPAPQYPYPYPGNLVVGGTTGPQYKQWNYGGCFYRTDQFWVYPKNGFTGTVSLELLNLPAGVTSQTAPSIIITSPTRPKSTSFLLLAASGAATGSVTVTVRATSGSIVKTLDRQFWIVNELPPCE